MSGRNFNFKKKTKKKNKEKTKKIKKNTRKKYLAEFSNDVLLRVRPIVQILESVVSCVVTRAKKELVNSAGQKLENHVGKKFLLTDLNAVLEKKAIRGLGDDLGQC